MDSSPIQTKPDPLPHLSQKFDPASKRAQPITCAKSCISEYGDEQDGATTDAVWELLTSKPTIVK